MATTCRRVSVLLPVPPYNSNSAFILEKNHVKKICKKPGINKQRLKKKKNYPKLNKETPETLENLIDTIKHHLCALKNSGDSVSSNTIIIGLVQTPFNNGSSTWEIDMGQPTERVRKTD